MLGSCRAAAGSVGSSPGIESAMSLESLCKRAARAQALHAGGGSSMNNTTLTDPTKYIIFGRQVTRRRGQTCESAARETRCDFPAPFAVRRDEPPACEGLPL